MRKKNFWRSLVIVCVCFAAFSLPATSPVPAAAVTFLPDVRVAGMLAQVQPNALFALAGSLSGEWPALVDEAPYTFQKRGTSSGVPIQKATQYVFEQLQAFGLSPAFDNWSFLVYSGRNVVGTLPGTTLPDQIVILTAHLDDAPGYGLAPGADDNASGVIGLLLTADILRGYRFERTLRFVFFTGEEQGMLGSQQYATKVAGNGDKIVAVINLDMIAWDGLDGPVVQLHARPDSSGDLGIAEVFANVASAYNLDLTPVINPDGYGSSDHVSFWTQGYPAILAIEDDVDDFNPYYHSRNDRLSHLNLAYFEEFVKAAVGAGAHLAGVSGTILGDYQAQSGPPTAMQWGSPAEVVTYTLQLTNTGNQTDTYQLSMNHNAWITSFPADVGPLAAGASTQLTVNVSVPAQAAVGAADIASLRIISGASGTQVDQVDLTTVVPLKYFYLPLVRR